MSVFVCIVALLAVIFSLLTNRDVFSPGKFYLISFIMFYAGALASPDDHELWLLVLLVLMVGIATVCLETHSPPPRAFRGAREPGPGPRRERSVALWVWLATLPAIAAQIYIVQLFGGIEGYISMFGNRVIEFRGLGWAKTLMSTVVALNLIYFGVGLTRRRSKIWWSAFAVHVLVVLGIGALAGSRGSILTIFPIQLVLYHYLRRPVKIHYAIPAGAVLIGLAVLIGIARQGLKLDDGAVTSSISTGTYDQVLTLSIFNYGVLPLHILLAAADLQLAYGSTLLSVFTNPVPRDWWPEKPDTGGVFFTKVYTGDAWDGASNLTPTYLGEWVINFDWSLGLLLFLATSLVIMYFVVRYYRRVLAMSRERLDAEMAIDVVIYILVMWSAVALMVAEITNTVQNLLFTQLLPALVFKLLLKPRRIRRFHAPVH